MTQASSRLTREAAEPYRYIWTAWCQWLRPEGDPDEWTRRVLSATPEQALEFLARQVKPAAKRGGGPGDISVVTRERYCMVLRDMYAHLMRKGRLTHNPMKHLYELAGDERPDAEVLATPVLDYLRNKWLRTPVTGSPFDLRDRALMLLMLDAALTPAELAALTLGQLSEDAASGAIWLTIGGSRAAQKRQLLLDQDSSRALLEWLPARSEALLKGEQDKALVAELVFFTERRRPLSRRVLFHLTSTEIESACKALGLELPRHVGPLVLRNTAILGWVRQGMEEEEVCRRAGYQGALSLQHLRVYRD